MPFSLARRWSTRLLKPLALSADQKGLELLCDIDAGRAGRRSSAIRCGCGRCWPTWSATPSSSPSAATCCSQVREDARGDGCTMLHFEVTDTGIGIPAGQARHDLRGVQPGGRLDDAPVRRHRPRADDLRDARAADGRAHLGRERARRRAARSTSPPPFDVADAAGDAAAPSRCSPTCRCSIVDDNAVNRRILADAARRGGRCGRRVVERRPRGARRADAPRPTPARRSRWCCSTPTCRTWTASTSPSRSPTRPELAGATIMMLTSSGQYGDAARCRALGHRGVSDQADRAQPICSTRSAACSTAHAAPRPRTPAPTAAPAPPVRAAARSCSPKTTSSTSASRVGLLTQARPRRSPSPNNGREALDGARARRRSTSC